MTLKNSPFLNIAESATAGLDCLCSGSGFIINESAMDLRQRFLSVIENGWVQNSHNLENIPCVYAMVGYNLFTKQRDICYIGSTIQLYKRYKSHQIPNKIKEYGLVSILFYLPMEVGFYEYEKKLISKLLPQFNQLLKKPWR